MIWWWNAFILIVLSACSLVDDFEHRVADPSLDKPGGCTEDGLCARANFDQVFICVEDACVRPEFPGGAELTSPVNQNESVMDTLSFTSSTVFSPPSDAPLRIEAENIVIDSEISVNAPGPLARVEFVASNSIFLKGKARFSATQGNAVFLFRAGSKLYQDGQANFDSFTSCHCLYADGGNETTDLSVTTTPVCSVPQASCYRPD